MRLGRAGGWSIDWTHNKKSDRRWGDRLQTIVMS